MANKPADKPIDVAESIKIPTPGRKMVPSRTGEGLIDAEQRLSEAQGGTGHVISRMAEDPAPSPQAAPTPPPKVKFTSEAEQAKARAPRYRVLSDHVFWWKGMQAFYRKGDVIDANHIQAGAVDEMRAQGVELAEIAG